jgi:RNA polymerase sigma-70 factor, ECF subfamily
MNAANALRLRTMVDLHWSSLSRVLRNFGVPEAELDDALQQAYLVAADKLDAIEAGKERAFLVGTCVHVAARVRRAKGRSREAAEEAMDAFESEDDGADAKLDAARARAKLEQVLAAMDDELREVFVLHEIEQMTMASIALSLDLAPGTVASRLRRAREWFHNRVRSQKAIAI